MAMWRGKKVDQETGKGKTSRHDDIRRGLLTKPVKLCARASGWPDYEIKAIVAARIVGASDAEIRKLVRQLEAARKTVDQQPPQIEGA